MKIAKIGNDRHPREGGDPISQRTDDLRISAVRALIPPQLLLEEMPSDAAAQATVSEARPARARAHPAAASPRGGAERRVGAGGGERGAAGDPSGPPWRRRSAGGRGRAVLD